MARFGIVPPEVPVERSLDVLAPKFRAAVERMLDRLAGGRPEWLFETLRTPERQEYLYGFGRAYDDGRGVVTFAADYATSWHGYGLAVDVVEKDATPWIAPQAFWAALGAAAVAEGLTWGGHWRRRDLPHVQWGRCPASPPVSARALLQGDGREAVWEFYGAGG